MKSSVISKLIMIALFILQWMICLSQFSEITLEENTIIINDPLEPKLILDQATGPQAEISLIPTGQLQLKNLSNIQLQSMNGDVVIPSKVNIASSSTADALGLSFAVLIRNIALWNASEKCSMFNFECLMESLAALEVRS